MNFWNIAGLSPTKDEQKIKKVYADLIKIYTPHDHPDEFKEIREAYEDALRYANEDNFNNTENIMSENTSVQTNPNGNEQGRFNFSFGTENNLSKLIEKEAGKLIELFSSENRDEWVGHITSDEFLDVFRNKEFVERVHELAHVNQLINQDGVLVNKVAIDYLKLAYAVRDGFEYIFDGVEYIEKLVGSTDQNFENYDDIVLAVSFQEYYLLWKIAHLEYFNFHNIKLYNQIIFNYTSWNMVDKITYIDENMNKKLGISVNLIKHIFSNYELTREMYIVAFQALQLSKTINSVYEAIYEEIKEIIIKKAPEVVSQRPNISVYYKINKELESIRALSVESPEKIESLLNTFFGKEELKESLHSVTYILDEVAYTWIDSGYWQNKDIFIMFIKKAYEIIEDDMKIPYVQDIKGIMYEFIEDENLKIEFQKDSTITEVTDKDITVYNRTFFRYYMNVAFPTVKIGGNQFLNSYIQDKFRLNKTYAEVIRKDNRAISLTIANQDISICFHKFYMEYTVGERTCFGSCFKFTELFSPNVNLENINQDLFWILLPMCYDTYDNEEYVFDTILGRLNHLGYQDQIIEDIARIISRDMCKYGDSEELRDIRIIGENNSKLYFCDMDLDESVVYIIERSGADAYKCIDSVEIEAETLTEFIEESEKLLRDNINMNDDFGSMHLKMMPKTLEYVSGGEFSSSEFVNDEYRNRVINNPTKHQIELMFELYKDAKIMFFMLHFEDENTKQKRVLTMVNYMDYGCFCHDVATSTRYALINPKQKSKDKGKFFFSPLEECLSHKKYTEIMSKLPNILDDVCDFSNAELKEEFWAKETFDYANVGDNRKEAFELDRILIGGQEFADYSNPIYMKNLILYKQPKTIFITNKYGNTELREYNIKSGRDTDICINEEVKDIIERALDNKLQEVIMTWYKFGANDKANEIQMIIKNDDNGNTMFSIVDSKNDYRIVLKNYDYVQRELQNNKVEFLGEEVNAGLVIGCRELEDRLYLRNIMQIFLMDIECVPELTYHFAKYTTGYASGRFIIVASSI